MSESKPPRVADPAASPSKYREQFGVIVLCADAAEQERVYDALRAAGYKLRVVTT